MVVFPDLCKNLPWTNLKYVIADKGYETSAVKSLIRHLKATPVIPPKANRVFPETYDKKLYRTRCKIEHFFSRIKEFKRLALRFDKLDSAFISFVACAILLISQLLC